MSAHIGSRVGTPIRDAAGLYRERQLEKSKWGYFVADEGVDVPLQALNGEHFELRVRSVRGLDVPS